MLTLYLLILLVGSLTPTNSIIPTKGTIMDVSCVSIDRSTGVMISNQNRCIYTVSTHDWKTQLCTVILQEKTTSYHIGEIVEVIKVGNTCNLFVKTREDIFETLAGFAFFGTV